MKKNGIILALSFLSIFILKAQEPDGYYNSAYNKAKYELKTELHNIIDDHNVISYDGLWSAFKTTDITANGKVWDMYSNCTFSFGGDQCGNYKNECDCYNREHSFPKSWFNDGKPMYSDMFHLYPTDGKVNGMRGNHPFGEVSSPSYTSSSGCKVGSSSTPGYSGTAFEPVDEYKGDFARSYFYMATRYQDKISNWNSAMLNQTSQQAFSNWAKDMLVKWHREDPVSEKEIKRNNAIYEKFQHNRNPFIDHPELVEKIWGNDNTPWTGSEDTIPPGPGPDPGPDPDPDPQPDTLVCYTLAELISKSGNTTTVYTFSGKAYITMIGTQRGQKYLQDATGAIMIDDNDKKITTTFAIGDYITDIKGKWLNYYGLLEFIPQANAKKTDGEYIPQPQNVTLSTLKDKTEMNKLQSKLIRVKAVEFADQGSFVNGKVYRLKDDAINDSLFRVHFYSVDYVGESLPEVKQDIIGIAVLQREKYYISPRFSADIKDSDPSVVDKDSMYVMFIVKNEGARYIEDAKISGLGEDIYTTMDGAALSQLLPAEDNYTYTVTHDKYKDFASSFYALHDTTINIVMEPKLSNNDLERIEDISAYTIGKTVYISGNGLLDNIEIYTLMGEKIYSLYETISVDQWSYSLDRSGLFLIRIKKGGAYATLKVVVR